MALRPGRWQLFAPAVLLFVSGWSVLSAASGGKDGHPLDSEGFLPAPARQGNTTAWDNAFQDRSGDAPVHFVARYLDGRGAVHRLEEWRIGQRNLRRITDDRIDLHADAAGTNRDSAKRASAQPLDYVWQIIDLQKHIDHRVSTAGMLHLGMLYSYYSMAHVLSRPAGAFTVQPSSDPEKAAGAVPSPLSSGAGQAFIAPCAWWQIEAADRPSTRVCWLPHYGVPGRTYVQTPKGWQLDFALDTIETRPLPPAIFAVDTKGLQVRDVDEIESED